MHSSCSTGLPFRRSAIHAWVAACLLLLGGSSSLRGQAGVGTVTGLAERDEDGAPISFALVRLLPLPPAGRAASASPAVAQSVTTERGRFRFTNVSPGDYRLQLARIGFRPALSAVLVVGAGATVEHRLRVPSQVVQLATVTVRGGSDCLTGAQLTQEPRVAGLWAEAQKGVEIRRTFDRQYRYSRTLEQDVTLNWRLRPDSRRRTTFTLVNEPDSAAVREARAAASRRARGYARDNVVDLPDERELLGDAFLQDHCLETTVTEGDGALGLRFRPVERRRESVDVRGTIWVEAETYQVRRVEFEYLDDGDPYARATLDYADLSVGGAAIRLPSGGHGWVRLRGPQRALISGADATFAIRYSDIAPGRTQTTAPRD
jgi:hypothetical protein